MLIIYLKGLIRLFSLTKPSIISCPKYDTYLSSEVDHTWLDVSVVEAQRAHELWQKNTAWRDHLSFLAWYRYVFTLERFSYSFKKKIVHRFFFGGDQVCVKKGYTIFFMDVLPPEEHVQYHYSGRHHKSVPKRAKFLLWSMLWGTKPGKNILCYSLTYT